MFGHPDLPRFTVRMCKDSGQKKGDMRENMAPLHSAFRRSNRHNTLALQVKSLMPWELFLSDAQIKSNSFRFKLRIFGHQELR